MMKDKLSDMIQNAVGGCAKYWADVIAEKLVASGVTILPEGAMILTRAELDALNKYQERFKGQDAEAVIASEVAKEIFKESEDIFNRRIAFYTDMAKQSEYTSKDYAETMIRNCKIYLQELAELGKKYTEGEG
jgi:hypothetical protein